jgi:hypothetical protein
MITPAYASVTSISLKEDSYSKDDKFTFVGIESEGGKSIFVIIRGSSGNYVGLVSDPVSDPDGYFETIERPVDDFFTSSGTYNATAFVDDQQEYEGIIIKLNYDGKRVSVIPNFVLELKKIGNKSINEKETLSFTVSTTDSSLQDLEFMLDQNPPSGATINSQTGLFSWTPTETQGPASYIFDIVVNKGAVQDRETITVTVNEVTTTPEPEPEPQKNIPDFIDPKKGAQYYLDRYNKEAGYKAWFDTNFPDYTIQEAIELAIPGSFPDSEPEPVKKLAPFVDPKQDPQYYIDRYNSESSYKDWFDENFPDQTIYDAVGLEEPKSGFCGKGTHFFDGVCVADQQGGCLIATAAFGSEMSPQVQMLREIRDNAVLGTESGSSFMHSFNSIYYTFSPTIADWERESPIFKDMVRVGITPLLSSLSILSFVDIDSEQEILGYGLGIIFLNLGMYFVVPVFAVIKIRKYLIKS